MRELAEWDVDQYDRILCWPVREALLSFEQKLKRERRDDYQQELLRYAVQSPWLEKNDRRPPELPPILKD